MPRARSAATVFVLTAETAFRRSPAVPESPGCWADTGLRGRGRTRVAQADQYPSRRGHVVPPYRRSRRTPSPGTPTSAGSIPVIAVESPKNRTSRSRPLHLKDRIVRFNSDAGTVMKKQEFKVPYRVSCHHHPIKMRAYALSRNLRLRLDAPLRAATTSSSPD